MYHMDKTEWWYIQINPNLLKKNLMPLGVPWDLYEAARKIKKNQKRQGQINNMPGECKIERREKGNPKSETPCRWELDEAERKKDTLPTK